MPVQTAAFTGTYEELADRADEIASILDAVANDLLDLSPAVQAWLVAQLERIEGALAAQLDGVTPTTERRSG